jgi:hypothetical protein
MDFKALMVPAVIWVTATSLFILISYRWRWSITGLALQYIGIFFLVSSSWPIELAATKLVAGWMACAVLGIAIGESIIEESTSKPRRELSWLSERIFRLLTAGLVILTVQSLAPKAVGWIPGVEIAQLWGGLILIGMGLIQLGFTAQPSRVIVGLLTFLSGFEVLYATVESSALLAGLLATINLGIALAGAYLVIAAIMEKAG